MSSITSHLHKYLRISVSAYCCSYSYSPFFMQ
uniref:Uncharacterized protein n=1 Tax=Siphoviridae sp. ctZd434 TaxID=2825559 RepID=A0A8S5UHI1_9CAUD|nr:MAG TPA: hypothetical protein [Siphoviridae sp. ctZd434]